MRVNRVFGMKPTTTNNCSTSIFLIYKDISGYIIKMRDFMVKATELTVQQFVQY